MMRMIFADKVHDDSEPEVAFMNTFSAPRRRRCPHHPAALPEFPTHASHHLGGGDMGGPLLRRDFVPVSAD
jgi:hypothetical protein